jgi:hypothetical protein
VAYSLATTIGGSTPAIVTYLIHETGNRAIPGAWLSLAAAIALVGAHIALPRMREANEEGPVNPSAGPSVG